MKTVTATPLGIAQCELAEGPVWLANEGELVFVDISGRALHRYGWGSGTLQTRVFGAMVCCAVPAEEGGLLVAVQDELVLVQDGQPDVSIARDLPPGMRFNDGKCDPAGRLLIGMTHLEFEPGAGALLRLEPQGTLTVLVPDLTIANGLAWTRDGRTLYHIDSPARAMAVYDYAPDTGEIIRRRALVDLAAHEGIPDGMAQDTEGRLWIAFWGGSSVKCFTPDGSHVATVELPVSHVTSCCFAGPELDVLTITTARGGPQDEPGAGDIYVAEVGASGVPDVAWARS